MWILVRHVRYASCFFIAQTWDKLIVPEAIKSTHTYMCVKAPHKNHCFKFYTLCPTFGHVLAVPLVCPMEKGMRAGRRKCVCHSRTRTWSYLPTQSIKTDREQGRHGIIYTVSKSVWCSVSSPTCGNGVVCTWVPWKGRWDGETERTEYKTRITLLAA